MLTDGGAIVQHVAMYLPLLTFIEGHSFIIERVLLINLLDRATFSPTLGLLECIDLQLWFDSGVSDAYATFNKLCKNVKWNLPPTVRKCCATMLANNFIKKLFWGFPPYCFAHVCVRVVTQAAATPPLWTGPCYVNLVAHAWRTKPKIE